MFQNRGRPQGNIHKKGYRVFPKSSPIVFFELFEILKSSLDALDGLFRPDRGGFLERFQIIRFKKVLFWQPMCFRKF